MVARSILSRWCGCEAEAAALPGVRARAKAGSGSYYVWLALTVIVSSGQLACRSHRGFREDYVRRLRPVVARGEWTVAAESILKQKGHLYREEDRVMFWLNHGTALHYAGNYQASSEAFFQAEETMQELWTESISEEVGKAVLTETIQTYTGEDYERILTYLYTSINAVSQGRVQDAVVEARRADGFLQKMRVEYEKEGGLGTLYKQDAFALWLIGLFYELEGSHADAYIAYEAAHQAYSKLYSGTFGVKKPPYLEEDLFRSARLAGRDDEASRWEELVSGASLTAYDSGMAEVILIHGNGEAPFKTENTFTAPAPDGYLVRVAMPELKKSPRQTQGSKVRVGKKEALSVVAEPVEQIAVRNFEGRIDGIRARAIARAITKYLAVKATSEAVKSGRGEGSKLAGNLITIFGGLASAAAEGADLRSWTLLPAEFRVARVWVEPGTYPIEVELLDGRGVSTEIAHTEEVTLNPGDRRLVSMRSVR